MTRACEALVAHEEASVTTVGVDPASGFDYEISFSAYPPALPDNPGDMSPCPVGTNFEADVLGPSKTRAQAHTRALVAGQEHTLGQNCPACPGEHGGPGPCDHTVYSRAFIRFVAAHTTEFTTAYFNPDKRSSRAVLQRLAREYVQLPPRHSCSCPGKLDANMPGCPSENVSRGFPACPECRQLRERDKWILVDVATEIGRTAAVEAPMPDVVMLDAAAGYLGLRR